MAYEMPLAGHPRHQFTPTRNADELVPMARPVYPYPNVAEYDGVGDVTAAGSWSKGGPAEVVALRKWAGIDLFRPYSPIE